MATIRITDGRSHLWRYDTGVQIQLLGCSHATECHFVAPGGVIRREMVDGVCDVPDAALTVAGTLTIYAFERNPDGGTTRHSFMLLVQDRPRPADYIDPPDEYDNLQALAERVAPLIPGGGGTVTPEQIGQAVEDYLTENPVQVQETDPTVYDWAKQQEKPTYTAEEVGALDKNSLGDAIDDALAQAKESGEFDGEPGYTPVKGTDYFTDADKAEMVTAVIAALPVYAGEVADL